MSVKLCGTILAVALAAMLAGPYGCKEPAGAVKDDAVLAVVNGTKITVDDFKAYSRDSVPKGLDDRKAILTKIIQNRLLSFVAIHRGLGGSPEVKNRDLAFETSYLPGMLREEIAKGVTVKDEDIPKYMVTSVPVLELSQISTSTLEEAETAVQEVNKGKSFEDVASKMSNGATAKGGGFLGAVSMDTDIYSPGVKAVLNKLKPGETSQIIKTEMGYAIFKLKSRKEPAEIEKNSRESARQVIKEQKVEAEMAKLKEKLASEAKIELNQKLLDGDNTQVWAAKLNGLVISIPPGLLKSSADVEGLHTPHQAMKQSSVISSLRALIDRILLTDEAKRRGLDKDPHYARMFKILGEEHLAGVLVDNGLGTFDASPQEMEAYYNKNKERLVRPEGVRIGRILANSKADAEKALAELKTGKGFSEVAAKYSQDKSRLAGGDMGWHSSENLTGPFKAAAASLKKGEISGIIKTEAGYDIITVEDRVKGGVPDLSDIQETVKKRVMLQKRSDAVESLYKEVSGRAKIEVNEALLKSI